MKDLQEFTGHIALLTIQLRRAAVDVDQDVAKLDAAADELTRRHDRVNEILGVELRAVLGRAASASC